MAANLLTSIDSSSSSNAEHSAWDKFLYPVKDGVPRVPFKAAALLAVIGLVIFGAYRWYQDTYSLVYGLDAFEPEFQTYFMNVFWAQIGIIGFIGLVSIPAIWFTRPKNLLDMSPLQELSRYYLVFSILAVASVFVLIIMALYAESDAAWHQITIRDTDFTPTHIGLFYFAMPLLIVGLMVSFVWVHTRLPDYHQRVSIPMCIVASGPLLIMPNLGFNEWGHTFFYAEELFAAPIHYGFVALGWAFFGIGGLLLQMLNRVRTLTTLVKEESQVQLEAA